MKKLKVIWEEITFTFKELTKSELWKEITFAIKELTKVAWVVVRLLRYL